MISIVKKCLIIFIILIPFYSLFSQNLDSMEFRNQSITDILLVLGEVSGKSIIPDETVKGNASYYFSNTDFETALSLFLTTYNYYYREDKGIYYVSRIKISVDESTSLLSLDAEDTDIQLLIRVLSRNIGKTILYDALPRETISIHCENLDIDSIMNILIKKFVDYRIEKEPGFYYIRKFLTDSSGGHAADKSNLFLENQGLFSASFQQIRFKEALESLFKLTGKEYSFLGRNDSIIEKFDFKDKNFEQILRLLLEQGNGDYSIVDDIYYIIDIERKDVLKKFYTTVTVPLRYMTTSDVQSLIPSSIGSSQNLKIDKTNNAFILSGTLEEVAPLQDFINHIDQPSLGMEYHRFQLSNLDVSSITGLIPSEYQFSQPIILKDSNSFIMMMPVEMIKPVTDYLKLIDINTNGYAVELKYIKGEELMENPPPSVNDSELIQTNNPNIIYFQGSEDRYRKFLKDLELLDKPIPQIRYEVLVMQIQETEGFNWNVDNSLSNSGGDSSIIGNLSELLTLNFDAVSQFGLQFASTLNVSLSNSESKVMADTSLNALSGEITQFQNTETYRYTEVEIDADSDEETSTGIAREITSGLIVKIEGWSSGDGMITMEVSTTISNRDDSESADNTTTTERVVSSHVRTESGKPVIIGGLMQEDKSVSISKIPILGDIPLLGYLFTSKKENVQNTEVVVTIVPYLEFPEYSINDVERSIENLYNKFVRR
jgi:type II secretory pathway component GspD/PulD (secretin)